MIGYLSGKLISFKDSTVLLNVNGVGYEVTCSSSSLARLINDRGGEIFTYMAVKEDGVSLYGFDTESEKEMFLSLIGVSGVGPKVGLLIVSSLGVNMTRQAILNSDVKTLSSVKGLGKKTAEKIIVELRGGLPMEEEVAVSTIESDEALQALMSLGYDRNTSLKAIKNARENGAITLEDIITYALRSMV